MSVGRFGWLLLGGLFACAPTASAPGPTAPPQRPAISEGAPGPDVAAVPAAPSHVPVPPPAPTPPPPPPPPPVIDAEQRAILDALDEVAKTLEPARTPADLAAALGVVVESTRAQGLIDVTPRQAVLSRIRVDRDRRPTENYVEVTLRTPTSAVILGTRFGVLTETGLVPEFDDPYLLTTCRRLPDGGTVSIDVMFDWVPALGTAEPTSVVYLQRWSNRGCP